MRLLLDTHLLIWAMGDPRRLGDSLRERLEDPAHTLLFSVASLWELVIKASSILSPCDRDGRSRPRI